MHYIKCKKSSFRVSRQRQKKQPLDVPIWIDNNHIIEFVKET